MLKGLDGVLVAVHDGSGLGQGEVGEEPQLDDLPLGLIGEAISRTSMEEWIWCYGASRPAKKPSGSRRSQVRPDVL